MKRVHFATKTVAILKTLSSLAFQRVTAVQEPLNSLIVTHSGKIMLILTDLCIH